MATALATAVASLQQETADDASRVMLLDCDVEEPNAHLYLDPVFEKSQEVGVLIPVVDHERCDFCRRCAEVCAYHAIAVLGKEVLKCFRTVPRLWKLHSKLSKGLLANS